MLALQAMRAAYSGIQYCCEALREGTVEVQRIKKEVTQGVDTVKAAYKEITGLWSWLQSLFGAKPPSPAKPAAPAVAVSSSATEAKPRSKKKSKASDEYIEHIPTQDEVVQQFIGHMGDWFERYSFLKSYTEKRYAEVFGKDVIDNKEVLELTQLQAEVDAAYPTLSTLMSGAPWQLGPIWTQFKEMQDKVKAGQAARQMKAKREKAKRDADAAQARSDRIDRNMTWFWGVTTVVYFWMLMGTVWLNTKATQ